MPPESRGFEKIAQLIERGAVIPAPATVDIGDEVEVGRIAGDIAVYPGCRIYGAKTVICAGTKLGAEGPVTIEDCRLGRDVELKGGYFRQSTFLDRANMGSGAQVREACLLEEEAGGAHCVGLKQTILFPFVTLGSLINFCDCFMSGGTSRNDHSEVGSSYIHFNFTPDGDKATPSLFGDVAHGVALDRPPIFLGGQGGAVGPLRVAFGTVVAAGSILRHDVLEEGKLVSAAPPPDFVRDRRPRSRTNIRRVVRNNLLYLANLVALEQWYAVVRRPFFARQELGELVYAGALEMLSLAKTERVTRLLGMAGNLQADTEGVRQLQARGREVCALFETVPAAAVEQSGRLAAELGLGTGVEASGYVDAIKGLTPEAAACGVHWLENTVMGLMAEAGALLPALEIQAVV
jgi:hypothetical protein